MEYTQTELLALNDPYIASMLERFHNGELETVAPEDLP